ncbi:MAG TPA: class I SAM-dependent methyltransferase [Saprospiraceae bacterium]|nr:class I SAM-dependent methyltransferase [Saprospiraceae bacterium]HND89064.1 class I SAM-dependent methyltransferase [Saprospiraceae bacterium]
MLPYPQREFAEAVAAVLQSPPFVRIAEAAEELVDVPCGSGATTWLLARALPHAQVLGVDRDEGLIAGAKRTFRLPRLRYEVADIQQFVEGRQRVGICCLINSLFLLHEAEGLLRALASKMGSGGLLLCILPNVEGSNYAEFQRLRPEVNLFELKKADFADYFARCGWAVALTQGIVFQRFYGLWWPRWLGPLRAAALRWLHLRKSHTAEAEPCYYLLAMRAM